MGYKLMASDQQLVADAPGTGHWIMFDGKFMDPDSLWNHTYHYLELTNQTVIRRWKYSVSVSIYLASGDTIPRESLVYMVPNLNTQDPATLRNKLYFPTGLQACTIYHSFSGIIETTPNIAGEVLLGVKYFIADTGEPIGTCLLTTCYLTLWEVT